MTGVSPGGGTSDEKSGIFFTLFTAVPLGINAHRSYVILFFSLLSWVGWGYIIRHTSTSIFSRTTTLINRSSSKGVKRRARLTHTLRLTIENTQWSLFPAPVS